MGSVKVEKAEPPKKDEVTVYIKAGVDGQRIGACPFCQRIFMVLLLKAQHKLLSFKVITVNPAKTPPEFKVLGLKHLPAIIHCEEGTDVVDDIIEYLDLKFPGGDLQYNNQEAELASKDFFSRFCFYIKDINEDCTKLNMALRRFDDFLQRSQENTTHGSDESPKNTFMCGCHLSHIDCEILPKLQHVRVAAKELKKYDIPLHFTHIWRYLHAAYSNPVFLQTCPSDQEIVLHWYDRTESSKVSAKKHASIGKEKPKYSLDIPVHATLVEVHSNEDK